jgi:peptide/nickel transport system substrate-binding protein
MRDVTSKTGSTMNDLRNILRLAGDRQNTRRDLMRFLGGGIAAAAAVKIGSGTVSASPVGVEVLRLSTNQDDSRPELVIGVQANPTGLDPAQAGFSVVAARTLYSIYDYLIEADYLGGETPGLGSELVPSLVTEWTRIDDLTMEFMLREGVLFHDGTPFTANDVKFTVDRVIAEGADPLLSPAFSQFAAFETVEVIDDLTFRVITRQPDAGLEQRFTYGIIFPVSQAAAEAAGLEAFNQMPIGTGPYKVVEFVPGDRIVLEAFAEYWGSPAAFSKVTFTTIPEVATRLAAVRSNECQIVTQIPPDQTLEIEGDDDLNVRSIAIANCHIFHYNTQHPAVANKFVRQGLNIGFDRQLLVDTLWRGQADVMRSYQLERWGAFYNPDRTDFAYDADRAKALLEQGGYDGAEIVYRANSSYYLLGAEAAQVITQMWQDLGVNARVEILDDLGADPENLIIRAWSNSIAPNDPAVSFYQWWGVNGSPQKNGLWTPEDPRFNGELAEALLGSMDQAVRVDAFQQMLDIWDDEAPAAILYNQYETYVQRSEIGWNPYTIYGMDFRARAISAD